MSARQIPTPPDQLVLPLPREPAPVADFLEDASNTEALAWIERADWPQRRLAIWGGAGVGKTHLLKLWARRVGGAVIAGTGLGFETTGGPLAIDDAHRAPEEALLHTLNFAVETERPILLAAPEPPARWPTHLADLASRLRTINAVELAQPGETLLRALLVRNLAERQLAVPQDQQDYLLLQLPRSSVAIQDAASQLDAHGMASGKSPSRAILRRIAQGVGAATSDPPIVRDEENAANYPRTSPDRPTSR